MAVNKVIFGGETVIDLTGDDVTPEKLVEGATAHDKSGASIVGTNPYEKAATDAAVADIATAIAEMGGEVPEGATITDMAAAVKTIPVGAKIDDTTPSESTTYSSAKIESMAAGDKFYATATIGTSWSDSGPYTQTVAVSGILASDTPIIDLLPSTDPDTAAAELEAWSLIYRIDTAADSITVYASEATTQAITIQILGVR